MKPILLALLCVFPVLAQNSFTYEKETSLSSATEKVTIHLATASEKTVRFTGATVYCSVACVVTLSRDGTAPTTTAGTAVALNTGTAGAVPYHASNVGSSTSIKKYNISAGTELSIDLSDKGLVAGKNLSLATDSITGTARIFVQWQEF